jgi:hypothetical protein
MPSTWLFDKSLLLRSAELDQLARKKYGPDREGDWITY